MADPDKIKILEDIIVENAGPLGKFVVKKSLSDLDMHPGSMDESAQNRLIDMVLERAVFDRDKWPSIRKNILLAWGGKGNA